MPVTLRASLNGGTLEVRGASTSAVESLVRSLPSCRWSRAKLCWTCEPTPAAAWRLTREPPEGVLVEVDDGVREMADRHRDSVAAAHLAASSSEQPALRVADSWRHQCGAYQFARHHEAALFAMGMGCVDASTEFLTPNGWKRIDEYVDGDLVAQFKPSTREAQFVRPADYVKLPCDEFWRFHHGRGLDMVVSDEHRVLWYDHLDRVRVDSAADIAAGKGGRRVRFATSFRIQGCVHAVGTGDYVHLDRQNVSRVPSPDGFKYCFEVPTGFLVLRRGGCIFATGNTGKSKPVVELVVNQDWRRTLVLCPTAVRGVWRREFARWSARPVEVLVLDQPGWSCQRQAEEAERFLTLCVVRGTQAVVVQNYESASYARGKQAPFGDWAVAQQWDAVVLDESHRIAKHGSRVSKFAHRLGRSAKRRLCLTGTPLSHSPLDVFGQARFLDPGVYGTSWHRFRTQYAVSGPFGADHIVGYRHQDDLAARMAQFTYEVSCDVLDLPPAVHADVSVTLGKRSLKAYRELEAEMVAAVDGGVVSASNGLVKLLRLQQMTGGFAQPDDGGPVVELGREKQDALVGLLEDLPLDEPVVVFCRFREDLARVQLASGTLGRQYGEISGRRRDLTPEATMPPHVQMMGVQVASGGVGIDLTRAAHVVFYSLGYSLTDYEQALRRSHRPGQTRTTHFWHLVCEDTVDRAVYQALGKRRDLVESVLDYLRDGIVEIR